MEMDGLSNEIILISTLRRVPYTHDVMSSILLVALTRNLVFAAVPCNGHTDLKNLSIRKFILAPLQTAPSYQPI